MKNVNREKIKTIFAKAGYKQSTIRSFLNGNRPFLTHRQIKAIELSIKDKLLTSILSVSLQSKSDSSYLKQNINKEAQKPSSAEDRSNRQEAV